MQTIMAASSHAPDRPAPQPTQTRPADLRSADAFEAIRSVGTDAGVEMLLDMPGYQAAQVLARYRPRARGELLQGIAATRPDVAGTILQMLSSVDIGPTMSQLMPETAASMLVAIPADEAVRILNHTSARAAAEVIMKLPVEVSAPLMKARLRQACHRGHPARHGRRHEQETAAAAQPVLPDAGQPLPISATLGGRIRQDVQDLLGCTWPAWSRLCR
jgi:hypothetical protein